MHSQDVRTIFVDTSWCTVENDGSFRMDLPQTVEVQPDLVRYITVTGSLPQVSTANNRLYVLERTPYGWGFAAAVSTSAGSFQVATHSDAAHAEYQYKADMGSNGVVFFQPDAERVHWAGLWYADNTLQNAQTVAATYSYITGQALSLIHI